MNVITKYIKNDRFNKTSINFMFQFKIDKEDIMGITILRNLMLYTNKKYNSEELFAREKLNRFILSYGVSLQFINDIVFMNFSIILPNPNIIKDDYIENAINFILDTIYLPNINNNLYDNELFEREKRIYIENLLNDYKNAGFIAEKNMLDLVDEEGVFSKLKYKDLVNINSLRNEDVVNIYNKYIKNTLPFIFINGLIEKKIIEDIIIRYIDKLNLKRNKKLIDYTNYLVKNNYIEKKDNSHFYESFLYLIYNIKDYKENDEYKLLLINLLLNSNSSDILFNNLRKKSNLVYTCGSSCLLKNNVLIVKAITSKKNIDMSIMVIKEVMESLKEIDNYKENISNILYRMSLNLERQKDSFSSEIDKVINNYFKTDISLEEELDILSNIDKDELLDVINRLNLVSMYIMEGK
ncbi:MAG: insulinase family protein [Bacilli bacterium]|nr:insulinase family protein [Bacilli bacterium]